MGDLSRNFSRAEFRCPHCGQSGHIDDALVRVLQAARDARGVPLTIVSGYRCPVWNARVGGTPTSHHLGGRAADVPRGYGTVDQWKRWGARGIGVRTGGVIHVDVRRTAQAVVFPD